MPDAHIRRTGTCIDCHGPITFHPRRADDPVSKTTSIDDSARWAHDRVSDWIGRPHRARAKHERRSA